MLWSKIKEQKNQMTNTMLKAALIMVGFSMLSLVCTIMANDFNANPPSKESYLNSEMYEAKKLSYDEAMEIFNNNIYAMHIFSIILLPIGVVAGASYYFFNRKESKK
jgi:ABC-type phosphate transport system permease subunit